MHGAGLNSSMAELVMGGTVILSARESFDAETLWDEVELNKVTRILIVGNVFARPLAQALEKFPDRWDLSELRVISSAGQMWSREVKQALVTAIPKLTLVDILGASEASGFGYAITTKDRETPTGYFEAGKQTVIIDVATDRVLDDGESGQGWLARRRPFAQGYFGDPEKTAATYREIAGELYAIPGDVAERDENGLIHLIGRGNLCINSGGEKIFVEEVEEALKRAPGIEDAMVVGIPDPKWGQAVIALVAADTSYVESDVRDALKQDLANYKIPKRIDVLDKLPRQPSGKGDYRMALELAGQ
jgi:fatty-acyl-CoA synthase